MSTVGAGTETLIGAIRINTGRTGTEQETALLQWQRYLKERFPLVHRQLECHAPDPWRLWYRWQGADDRSHPVLLLAHYDVVPAPPEGWAHPPFAGAVADGSLWGRGAIDNKLSHIAILHAVEELLHNGHVPTRSIYLAFGGDEETGGEQGAARIAEEFRRRGLTFAMTLDEGALAVRGMLPGLRGPAALVGCGEKGHINVVITGSDTGGHAATPARRDATTALIRALSRIQRHPSPTRRTRSVTAFVRALGRRLPGADGLLMRGYPLTAPLVHAVFSRRGETDAMLRTTRAVTMLSGSPAPNVLPPSPRANINIRLLPGDTIEETVQRLQRLLRRERVAVELASGWDNNEAPDESSPDGVWFELLERTIQSSLGPMPVLPYLVTATTDSRHYQDISAQTYRFVPLTLTREQIAGVHGTDERIPLDQVGQAIAFYRTLFENLPHRRDHSE